MPMRHARSETRGRPPFGRRGGVGKNGSTRSHNGSGSSAAAIPVHATSPTRIRCRWFCYALLGCSYRNMQIGKTSGSASSLIKAMTLRADEAGEASACRSWVAVCYLFIRWQRFAFSCLVLRDRAENPRAPAVRTNPPAGRRSSIASCVEVVISFHADYSHGRRLRRLSDCRRPAISGHADNLHGSLIARARNRARAATDTSSMTTLPAFGPSKPSRPTSAPSRQRLMVTANGRVERRLAMTETSIWNVSTADRTVAVGATYNRGHASRPASGVRSSSRQPPSAWPIAPSVRRRFFSSPRRTFSGCPASKCP